MSLRHFVEARPFAAFAAAVATGFLGERLIFGLLFRRRADVVYVRADEDEA
jgi:hypothetical protein